MVLVEEDYGNDTQSVSTAQSEVSEDGDDISYDFTENEMSVDDFKIVAVVLIGCLFVTAIVCVGMVTIKKPKAVQAIA